MILLRPPLAGSDGPAVRALSHGIALRVRERFSIALAISIVILVVLVPLAPPQMQDENAVKAAFVYNLTKYVQWPQADAELVIAVVGDGPVGEVLKKTLDGRLSDIGPIRVILSPSDEQLERCHLLYAGDSSRKQVRALLQKVSNKEVLTVGDSDFFAEEGGMVGLVRSGTQIQIQINEDATRAAHIKVSSRLLNLAVIVHSAPGGKS